MQHIHRAALTALTLTLTASLAHADGDALLQANGCLSCHAKAEKVVGPAFLSIADKYRGDKDAAAGLVQSIFGPVSVGSTTASELRSRRLSRR